jgi:DNA-directed RNA polymerase subunit RPC12/RpoP
MSISFNCEKCKKRVKAPDEAGGKYGNCPSCGHRLFIPSVRPENEPELVLQPIDETAETKISAAMRETYSLTMNILHETDLPDDGKKGADGPAPTRDMVRWIILYLRQVADGDLDGAQKSEDKLTLHAKQAKEVLRKMAAAERPEPELADIAPKVLLALMKNLDSKL